MQAIFLEAVVAFGKSLVGKTKLFWNLGWAATVIVSEHLGSRGVYAGMIRF